MSKFCMGCMNQYGDEFNICPHCGYIEDTATEESLHMEPGSILHDRYIIGRVLGFGGFGVTYLGWDAMLEQKVAIKEYLPSEFSTRAPGQTQITVYSGDKAEQFASGLSNFVKEAQRLVKFYSEAGIVRIFDSVEANNTAYIMMEYLEGETLAEFLKREKSVSIDDAIEILLPVINSLQVVNEQGIIHRDIAPDNIFLTTSGDVKVLDFGAARFETAKNSQNLTVIIKPGYSPEKQYRTNGAQGPYTDVYAMAATLYRMITGKTPPSALERRACLENNKKDVLGQIGKYAKISENQETALLNALNVRVDDRTPDMATFATELRTEEPEKVKRLYGKVKKIDLLKWPLWARIAVPCLLVANIILFTLFFTGVIGFDAFLQNEIQIPEGMTRVPSVINHGLEEAEDFLSEAELSFLITGRDYSDETLADFILSQNINGGEIVEISTTVGVIISGGNVEPIVPGLVPRLIFRDESEARRLIEGSELEVEVSFDYSETVAEGLIISQTPEPGTELDIGDQVNIVVSSRYPVDEVYEIEEPDTTQQIIEDFLIDYISIFSLGLTGPLSFWNEETETHVQEELDGQYRISADRGSTSVFGVREDNTILTDVTPHIVLRSGNDFGASIYDRYGNLIQSADVGLGVDFQDHQLPWLDWIFYASYFNLFDLGSEIPHILIDYSPHIGGFSMRVPNVLWEYNDGEYEEVRWRVSDNLDHSVLDGDRAEWEGEIFDNRRMFNEGGVRLDGLYRDAGDHIIGRFTAGSVPVGFSFFSQLDLGNIGYLTNIIIAMDWNDRDWESREERQVEFEAFGDSLRPLESLTEREDSVTDAIMERLNEDLAYSSVDLSDQFRYLFAELLDQYRYIVEHETFVGEGIEQLELISTNQQLSTDWFVWLNWQYFMNDGYVPAYFAFNDISGNGIPTLILGAESEWHDHPLIFGVHTWVDGEIYLLDINPSGSFLGERNNVFLLENGLIALQGSGSAFVGGTTFSSISEDGRRLEIVSTLWHDTDPTCDSQCGFFSGNEEITEQEYWRIHEQYFGRSVTIDWHEMS